MAGTPKSAKSVMPGKITQRLVPAPSLGIKGTKALGGPIKRTPIPRGTNKGR